VKKINLKSSKSTNKSIRVRPKTSLLIGIAVFTVTMIVFGVIFFLDWTTKSKITKAKDEIATLEGTINKKDYQELYDFQARLLDLKELLNDKLDQNTILTKLAQGTREKTTFERVSVKNKGEHEVELKAEIVTPNYDELSKQIESFSQTSGVTNVFLNSSQITDEGGLSARLSLSISLKDDLAKGDNGKNSQQNSNLFKKQK